MDELVSIELNQAIGNELEHNPNLKNADKTVLNFAKDDEKLFDSNSINECDSNTCEKANSISTSSDTIDTESADDLEINETLQINSESSKVTNSGSVPEIKVRTASVRSFGSESSGATLSSDRSGQRPKYLPADSSDEDNLLSELESELVNGVISSDYSSKKSGSTTARTTRKLKGRNDDRLSDDFYQIQLDVLHQNIASLNHELTALKNSQVGKEVQHKETLNQCKADYVAKLDKLVKQYESAKREKESMVVRYAQSEREVIILKKTKDDLEKKLHELLKDRESLNGKVRVLHADRVRACSSLDSKLAELAHTQRDFERLKDELNNRDVKNKWTQNKLKSEIEAHKETQTKLDQSAHRLQEMREESEQLRRDCQEMIRRYQEAEEIKSVSLDIQLKEKLSELEIQKQEKYDQDEVFGLIRQELDALKKRQKISVEENNTLTVKIQTLERDRLEYEQTLSKLKDSQSSLRQEVVDLNTRLSEMDNLRQQLEREKERVTAAQKEAERVRMANVELQSDMDACHIKEGELLEFTERLTAKSMQLQSEHSLLEVKAQSLEEDIVLLNKRVDELDNSRQQLQDQLDIEKKIRLEETQILARKLAEKTKLSESLNIKLEDSENENRVMKRRHLTSVKELSRELNHTKKRLDAFESPGASSTGAGDTGSLGSRTSSTGSLDTIAGNVNNSIQVNGGQANIGNMQTLAPQVGFSGHRTNTAVNPLSKDSHQQTSIPNTSQIAQTNLSQNANNCAAVNQTMANSGTVLEIDRQLLIERIVRIQKILARKNDKIEFLEEHIVQLLTELKKKSKIIQNYILREETGALVPSSMDQNKVEISRHKGIMASVYKSQLTDNHLTLELSLEINQKLQAVLEDTLLKNITLKENINTLGEEIARISKEQQDLQTALRPLKKP